MAGGFGATPCKQEVQPGLQLATCDQLAQSRIQRYICKNSKNRNVPVPVPVRFDVNFIGVILIGKDPCLRIEECLLSAQDEALILFEGRT
eukprot:s1261_g16.t1